MADDTEEHGEQTGGETADGGYRVANIISEIEHTFGRQPEAYMIKLLNDALLEISSRRQQHTIIQKQTIKSGKRWYELPDNAIDIMRVEVLDSNGRYVLIPKLSDSHRLLKEDVT